jgi:hypothetical protein
MSTYTKMNQIATAEVVTLLKQNLRVIDVGRGIVEYLPGWSDQEVATRAGVQSGPVQSLRLKHFGKLLEKTTKPEPPAKTDRMERLEAGVANILKELAEIRTELRALRDAAAPSNVTLFDHAARVGK